MLPPPGATPPPILNHVIFLVNIYREIERAKDENRNHL